MSAKRASNVSAISPEFPILGFLAFEPAHGYELYQRVVNELGQIWHISQSQLYNLLKRLEVQGDITGEVQRQFGLPDRRDFQITDQGRSRFEDWLNTPTRCSVRAIRMEFITRVYFSRWYSNSFTKELIEKQIAATAGCLNILRDAYQELKCEETMNRLSLDFRIQQLAFVLQWLNDFRSTIEKT